MKQKNKTENKDAETERMKISGDELKERRKKKKNRGDTRRIQE